MNIFKKIWKRNTDIIFSKKEITDIKEAIEAFRNFCETGNMEHIYNVNGCAEILLENIHQLYTENINPIKISMFINFVSENDAILKTLSEKAEAVCFIYNLRLHGAVMHSILEDKRALGIQELFKMFLKEKIIEGRLKLTPEEIRDLQIGAGAYSKVYQIKEYIIKIGKERKDHTIPYSKNVIQPLLKNEIKTKKSASIITIEIQREVIMSKGKEVKKINRRLIREGIFWLDAHGGNVGILKSNDKNRPVLPEGWGIVYEEMPEKIIKKRNTRPKDGKVVIDADYLEK